MVGSRLASSGGDPGSEFGWGVPNMATHLNVGGAHSSAAALGEEGNAHPQESSGGSGVKKGLIGKDGRCGFVGLHWGSLLLVVGGHRL